LRATRKQYEQKLTSQENAITRREQELKQRETQINNQQQQLEQQVADQVATQLGKDRERIADEEAIKVKRAITSDSGPKNRGIGAGKSVA